MKNIINFTHFSQRNTILNDKPNEDYIFIDSYKQIFMILDGVSRDKENGKYPNPSPALEITQLLANSINIFLQKHLENYVKNNNIEELLVDSIFWGNCSIKEYTKNKTYDFMPGTVGVISILIDNFFYYAFIGDCIGLKVSDNGHICIFTKKQTELIHKHKFLFNKHDIRNVICNNPEHPFAYGVLNGDDRAMSFVESGHFQLYNNDKIILATDGLESYIMNNLNVSLSTFTAKQLIQESHSLKNSKFEDDKSAIIIKYKTEVN